MNVKLLIVNLPSNNIIIMYIAIPLISVVLLTLPLLLSVFSFPLLLFYLHRSKDQIFVSTLLLHSAYQKNYYLILGCG